MLKIIIFTLFIWASNLSFAAGSKTPRPIYEEEGLEVTGTGHATGCSDAEYERADPRTRARIKEVRANPTVYAEYISYLIPRNVSLLRFSEDQKSLILTLGFRLTRCDEVQTNVYQPVYFHPHSKDAVVVFPFKTFSFRNYTAQATYSSQQSSLRHSGGVQIELPLDKIHSQSELEKLYSREQAMKGTLYAFHAISLESERQQIEPFETKKWIYSIDQNLMPSPIRLRKVVPYLIIDYELQLDASGRPHINNISLSSRRN